MENDGYKDKSHLRIKKKPKSKVRGSMKNLRDAIKWMVKRRNYESFEQMNYHDDTWTSKIDQSYYQEGKKAYKDLIQNYDELTNKEKREFEELRVYLE